MKIFNFWWGLVISLLLPILALSSSLGAWVLKYILQSFENLEVLQILHSLWGLMLMITVIWILSVKAKINLITIFRQDQISWILLVIVVILSTTYHFICAPLSVPNFYYYFFIHGELPLKYSEFSPSNVYNFFYIWTLVMAISIVPILEEILFRGLFLKQFLKRYSITAAILLSAFLFAIYHLNPLPFLNYLAIGIIASIIYIKTNSLLLAIFFHAFINFLAYLSIHFHKYLLSFFFTVWYIPVIIAGIVIIYLCLKYLDRLNGNKKYEMKK